MDAIVTVADREIPIAVEVKSRVDAGGARLLIDRAKEPGGLPLLVVARQTTHDARELLREQGVGIVDGNGNAHVELPGVVIHIHGATRGNGNVTTPARLSGKAGIVAQALLLGPEQVWKIADLAEVAGVSTGLAHRVLTRLEGEQIVQVDGRGPSRVRHLAAPAALLDLWAEEQHDQPHRALAYLLAPTSTQVAALLGDRLDASGVDHALTGAAAAALVAPLVTAVPIVEIWVAATAAIDDLAVATGAEPVTTGHNVVFLQAKDDSPLAFTHRVEDRRVVNRFRLYVDLLRDPRRGREQAQHLRNEAIGF